jgi:hypothetical protein
MKKTNINEHKKKKRKIGTDIVKLKEDKSFISFIFLKANRHTN